MSDWTHDSLARDLAQSRRDVGEIVAEKVGLGLSTRGGQLDVASIKPSWTNPNPTAWEVKISRSDFHSDAQAGKYRKYLKFVRRLYFAALPGLLSKADIPDDAGLTVRGPNGWSVVRAPRPRQVETENFRVLLMALLLKDHPAPWRYREPSRADRMRHLEEFEEWRDLRWRGARLSGRVKDALEAAADAERQARREIEYAQRDLARALGEEPDARTIHQLATELLGRRPPAPLVGAEQAMRQLSGAALQVARAREILEAATKNGDGG